MTDRDRGDVVPMAAATPRRESVPIYLALFGAFAAGNIALTGAGWLRLSAAAAAACLAVAVLRATRRRTGSILVAIAAALIIAAASLIPWGASHGWLPLPSDPCFGAIQMCNGHQLGDRQAVRSAPVVADAGRVALGASRMPQQRTGRVLNSTEGALL